MIIYTGGTFDLFHAGHINLLRRCKELAGTQGSVVVSLNSDEFVMKYKGKRPICSFEEREQTLAACRYVDRVVENIGGHDSKPSILEIVPDYIAIGSDWAGRNYYSQMGFTQEWLDSLDIGLIYIPYTKTVSSTEIKKRVNTQKGGSP